MSQYSNNLFLKGEDNNCWSILYDLVQDGSRVLDIGCSSGNFGEVLIEEKNCEVVGIDISKEDIKKAEKKLSKAKELDVERDDLKEFGKFDVIVLADVLEHLVGPVKVLDKLKKNLKPTGKILFSIPNMAHISTRLRLLEGEFRYTPTGILDNTHLHYYDEDEVLRIFTEAKLKIIEMRPTTLLFDDKIIYNRLEKLGLQASRKFFGHLKETKADIYQFVGVAENDPKVKGQKTKYIMPADELQKETQRLEKLTQNHINNLNIQIEEQKQAIEALRRQLQEITHSRTFRVAERLKNARSYFKGKKI